MDERGGYVQSNFIGDYRYHATEAEVRAAEAEEEDIYENEVIPSGSAQPKFSDARRPSPTTKETPKSRKVPKRIYVILAISTVLNMALAVCAIFLAMQKMPPANVEQQMVMDLQKHMKEHKEQMLDVQTQMNQTLDRVVTSNNEYQSDRLGSVTNPAKSCFHLIVRGQNLSGIYYIKTKNTSSVIQVFCDMESAGGGWTLVASVHENNIDGKCTSGDLWSSDQETVRGRNRGNGNWENFNVFGSPEAATSADYKSQAYYSLEASDVMIWHVPNDIKIGDGSSRATLKYYTETSFLESYGGNLQTLFAEHFPLNRKSEGSLSDVMNSLVSASPSMASSISSFYNYQYDQTNETNNYIEDGGSDMFDNGNKVFYQIGSMEEIWITYNEHYWDSSYGIEFTSSANQHPFHALMWIENNDRSQQSYAMRVDGNAGADGSGSYVTRTGSISRGQLSLSYYAYGVYGATDPSICKVFYVVTSPSWGSVVPTVTRTPWSSSTDGLSNGIELTGAPKANIVGYTLLSRTDGPEVSHSMIRNVLSQILSVFPDKLEPPACFLPGTALVQPVTYLRGNNASVTAGIPPNVRRDVSPGFVQFRSYNADGYPNALCPGVKVTTSCHPENICVGGINTNASDRRSCGDFAGWQGKSGDSPAQHHPSGSAKSLDDLNSSILIFTRSKN